MVLVSHYQIKIAIFFQFCVKKSAAEKQQITRTALLTYHDIEKIWYRNFKAKDYDIQQAECSKKIFIFK